MRASQVKGTLLSAAIIVGGLISAGYLGASIERIRPTLPKGYTDMDLAVHGSRLKGFSFGLEGLIADWYYMRSLQYIGDKVLAQETSSINLDDLRALNPRLLYPLLDNATTLDPHFLGAFYYGAVILPAINGEQAIDLTEKGILHNPNAWQLYQHLGYIYWKLRRYEDAAEAYKQGSDITGAAPFMGLMAAAMKTEGGSRDTARRIFQQMLVGTDDPAVRITAERRLAQLDSLDEREAIDAVLAEYNERHGRCPESLTELLPMFRNISLPGNNAFRIDSAGRLADPTGAPYLLDSGTCRTALDAARTGLSLK